MRVALIVDSLKAKTGGPSVIVKEAKAALERTGLNIKIISNDSLINSLKKKSALKIIGQSDICHIYGGWTYFHIKIFLLAFNLKKKIIIHPLGFYEPWSLNQKKIKKKLAWLLYQKKILLKSDLIHCASITEKKNLLKLNKNFNAQVIPYGISDDSIKNKINKKKIKKKAIYFSRLHKKKGIEDLIRCWNDIGNKDWVLDIYGPVHNQNYKDHLIRMANNNDNINFFNPIYNNKKKFKIFDNYDVMILPSYSENFGMVILESLARGLPVLTTINTPWLNIKNNNAGWVINSSYTHLKAMLKKIFLYPKKEFVIKSKNAIILADKFSWKNVSKIYVKTYCKLLNE
jgi:glycosyltransferase involved in cell wall biosynthesis